MGESLPSPLCNKAAAVLVCDQMVVQPGECVLITADTATDMKAINAIMSAAYAVDAKPAIFTVPQLPFQGALADPYVPEPLLSAVTSCDIWIDLCFPYLAGSYAYDEAMKGGRVRYLLAADLGSEGLARIYGQADLDELADINEALATLFSRSEGRKVRITTPLGTDVSFRLAKPGFEKPRRATKPGLHAVQGSTMISPEIESVRGTIVAETVFHEYYTRLSTPITLSVDGRIREVEGGGPEKEVMRRTLLRAGGGEFGYIIHFTCGYHPAARFTGRSFIEDMRVVGCDAVGMGLPWWEPGGGENHPDSIITMQSVWLDNEQIVEDGILVNPPELAEVGARAKMR